MEKDDLTKKMITLYSKIQKHFVDPTFVFPNGGRNYQHVKRCAEALIQARGGVLTKEMMVDYCVFQVYYWRNVKESGINWTVAHSFGKNAIKRFTDKTRGFTYYENLWIRDKHTNRDDLWVWCFGFDKHVYDHIVFMPAEESTKRRLHNSEFGYVICGRSTTLWSPLSPACNECVNMNRCVQRTASLYPELYRIRLESNKKENKS